jgi:hypothetical protein
MSKLEVVKQSFERKESSCPSCKYSKYDNTCTDDFVETYSAPQRKTSTEM